MKARIWLGITIIMVIVMGIAGYVVVKQTKSSVLSPIGSVLTKEKPLEKYSIENLSKTTFTPSQIVFDVPTATKSSYTVVPFSFVSNGKKVTGVAHLPMTPKSTKMPVVVQFRGFVPKEIYAPGVGTDHSAEVYAANGFLSLAPDFLGYGGSDKESENVFESRFETYMTALTLLSSIETIPFADTDHVFLWGHSNGGHIALTVLSVVGEQGKNYPTTLWAPVTKRFPYSILYYTDEADDYGKFLRKELAAFEKDYDVELYTFANYLGRITAPIQLHQGTADPSVPEKWSSDFIASMKKIGKKVTYYTYPGADHNLSSGPASTRGDSSTRGGWNTVVARDIQFFKSFLTN